MNHIEITRCRASLKASASAALLALGAVAAAGVAHAGQGAAACKQEIRRVAVWPISPRAQQIAKFEQREVTVCDGKVVPRKAGNAEATTASN